MSTIKQRAALRRAIIETAEAQGLSQRAEIARAVADLAREDAAAGSRVLLHALEEEVRWLRLYDRTLLDERDRDRRSTHICAQCGRTFYGRVDALTCSTACRQRAHRGRRAHQMETT